MTGFADPATHAGPWPAVLNRLAGPYPGSEPHVELAVTFSADFLAGASVSSTASSVPPGSARALPETLNV